MPVSGNTLQLSTGLSILVVCSKPVRGGKREEGVVTTESFKNLFWVGAVLSEMEEEGHREKKAI